MNHSNQECPIFYQPLHFPLDFPSHTDKVCGCRLLDSHFFYSFIACFLLKYSSIWQRSRWGCTLTFLQLGTFTFPSLCRLNVRPLLKVINISEMSSQYLYLYLSWQEEHDPGTLNQPNFSASMCSFINGAKLLRNAYINT